MKNKLHIIILFLFSIVATTTATAEWDNDICVYIKHKNPSKKVRISCNGSSSTYVQYKGERRCCENSVVIRAKGCDEGDFCNVTWNKNYECPDTRFLKLWFKGQFFAGGYVIHACTDQ